MINAALVVAMVTALAVIEAEPVFELAVPVTSMGVVVSTPVQLIST